MYFSHNTLLGSIDVRSIIITTEGSDSYDRITETDAHEHTKKWMHKIKKLGDSINIISIEHHSFGLSRWSPEKIITVITYSKIGDPATGRL